MKNEQLLNAFEQIDEEYIASAASTINIGSTKHAKRKLVLLKLGTLAACFCLACYALIQHISNTDPNLPLLQENAAMGFEGFMVYDISELDANNPWTSGASTKTLPVYKNLAYTDAAGTPIFLSEDNMKELANQTAAVFQEEVFKYDVSFSEENPYQVTATTENLQISVAGNGTIEIECTPPLQLPEECSFTSSDTSDAAAEKTLYYFAEEYSSLLCFNSPAISTWGDYTFNGEQNRTYTIYDQEDTLAESILNYNFNSVSFVPNQQGELWFIQISNLLSCAEKVGDCPIITEETALQSLLDGDHYTTVPEEYLHNGTISKDQVAKTELVYRTGNINEVFMPYYRFYVELPEFEKETMADGLKTYGVYYVPAISAEL